MLKQVSGDILLTSAPVIAHGVASGDHFDQGLALSLRKEYPAMAKDFRHFCKVEHPEVGSIWTWAGTGGRRIVNLLTQAPAPSNKAHPGKATVSNVRSALKELRALTQQESFSSLALPRLATGVGGLDWTEVLPLIEQQLGDLDLPVYLYSEYHAGVQAQEG